MDFSNAQQDYCEPFFHENHWNRASCTGAIKLHLPTIPETYVHLQHNSTSNQNLAFGQEQNFDHHQHQPLPPSSSDAQTVAYFVPVDQNVVENSEQSGKQVRYEQLLEMNVNYMNMKEGPKEENEIQIIDEKVGEDDILVENHYLKSNLAVKEAEIKLLRAQLDNKCAIEATISQKDESIIRLMSMVQYWKREYFELLQRLSNQTGEVRRLITAAKRQNWSTKQKKLPPEQHLRPSIHSNSSMAQQLEVPLTAKKAKQPSLN